MFFFCQPPPPHHFPPALIKAAGRHCSEECLPWALLPASMPQTLPTCQSPACLPATREEGGRKDVRDCAKVSTAAVYKDTNTKIKKTANMRMHTNEPPTQIIISGQTGIHLLFSPRSFKLYFLFFAKEKLIAHHGFLQVCGIYA